MKITVLNMRDAISYIPEERAIIIRMGDSFPFSKVEGEYINKINLYFSDVDSDSDYFIEDDEAKEILSFVDNNIDEINEIVVHCQYGQGRSPAVASAIADYLNISEIKYLEVYPNLNIPIYEKIKSFF